MKDKKVLVARSVLGLIFFVFGLNGFFQFIPMPPPKPAAGQFLGALAATGYFFPILKIFEVVCGALLLTGKYVALALVVLAPIAFNIFTFHLFLDPSGMAMAVVIVALGGYLVYAHRKSFKGIFAA